MAVDANNPAFGGGRSALADCLTAEHQGTKGIDGANPLNSSSVGHWFDSSRLHRASGRLTSHRADRLPLSEASTHHGLIPWPTRPFRY